MQSHLDRLCSIFNRQMTGIHNRTYGPILDMMFNAMVPMMMTSSTSMALHAELRDALISPSCRKVIMMAHGTGATVLSYTMDKLHADLPMELLSKMEIYTFGAAAKHMSNPCLVHEKNMDKYMQQDKKNMASPGKASSASQTFRMEEMERVIPVSLPLGTLTAPNYLTPDSTWNTT
jgi:hypothetical protein